MTENNEKIYWNSIHYGEIVSCEDFNFRSSNMFVTVRVIILDGIKRAFILCNGELLKVETIKS